LPALDAFTHTMHRLHHPDAAHPAITRRRFLGTGLAAGVAAALAGCKKSAETPQAAASNPAPVPPPPAPPSYAANTTPTATAGATARGVAMSQDGTVMASCHGGHVHVWSIALRGSMSVPEAERLPDVGALALSPDGKLLACGSGKSVVLVSLTGPRPVQTIAAHDAQVRALAFTPDGRALASGSADCFIRLWSVPDGAAIKALNVFSAVNVLAVTPDGKWLVSGSGFLKGDLALWSLPTAEPAGSLPGHESSVTGLAVSPDGSHLASSGGGKVRLWDLRAPRQPRAVLDNGTSDHDMAFLRAGKVLGCVADEGDVRMWLVPQGTDLGSLAIDKKTLVGLAALPGKADGLIVLDTGGTVWVGNAVTRSWRPLTPNSQGSA
jgi:WD40 repeat protein